ncbi:MAG: type II secretion system protein GspK [Bdellovibrionota bacterium]
MKTSRNILNQQGIAMMMTLVTMLILSILAAELVYQNQVYTNIVFRQRDGLRAKLLVRSALRLGLLQLRATEKAKAQIKSLGLGDESLANQIWQTPLILPPPALPGLTPVEKQGLEAFNKSLGLEGTLTVSITGESDRLDLNQLVKVVPKASGQAVSDAASKAGIHGGTTSGGASTVAADPEAVKEARDKLRKTYADVLDAALDKKRQDDEAFRDKYNNLKADTLLLNLIAFMDPATKTDADNRDKNEYYSGATPAPYGLKDAALTSLTELNMVKGFDDSLANLVSSLFTVQSTSSINVNKASGTMLQALIPELTNDNLESLLKRRDDTAAGGNFKTADEFWTYLGTLNNYDDAKKRLTDSGIQLLGAETTFRVTVSGEAGMVHKTWIASMGTMPPLSDADKAEAQQQNLQAGVANPPAQPTAPATDAQKTPANNSGDSMRIIYLKAD